MADRIQPHHQFSKANDIRVHGVVNVRNGSTIPSGCSFVVLLTPMGSNVYSPAIPRDRDPSGVEHNSHKHRVYLIFYVFNSNMTSISTGILSGREPMPTTLRTPTPLSAPQTCAKSSLHPLMTKGCRSNSGTQLTIPSTLMTRLILLKLPRLAFTVARIARPTWRAASFPSSMLISLPILPMMKPLSSFTGPCPET